MRVRVRVRVSLTVVARAQVAARGLELVPHALHIEEVGRAIAVLGEGQG